jgi:Flp pilus assembly protein TadG
MTPAKHRMRLARHGACGLCRLAARSGRDQRGSSMVEFALGASLLFMVVFGVIAMCLALYSYNVVSEAAREATRYAIVRGSACTSFATACPAMQTGNQGDIQTYVQGLTFPGINPNNLTAVPTWSPYPAGATCQPSALCNNPGNQVMVTVTYQFPLVIPFVPRRTLSMSSTAEMVISQ